MPYKITEDCISCGDCCVACEKDAIDDGYTYNTASNINSATFTFSNSFRIIEAECDECGSCVSVCPAGAIVKR